MTEVDEIRSPFLRRVIEQRGIKDDQVIDLLIVERYSRHPEPTNSIVSLMLKAIDREHPLEAAIVRRESELGRSLTEPETKALQARALAEGRAAVQVSADSGLDGRPTNCR
jgi:hypothetical protein